MLKNVYRSPAQARVFSRFCHAESKHQNETSSSRYGYVKGGHYAKRDEKTEGIVHLGRIDLPKPLKDSLNLYYKRYPRKTIIEDGLKLSRHLANRGRPTNATWVKYKKEMAAMTRDSGNKHRERHNVKQFILEEAIKAGLILQESVDENSDMIEGQIETSAKNDDIEANVELNSDEIQNENYDETENLFGNFGGDDDIQANGEQDIETDMKEGEAKTESELETKDDDVDKKLKTKRPLLTSYSMVRYGSRESTAYTACQLPAVYGSTYKVLSEIKKRDPSYEPSTLLDFGSGTGMTVWAANSVWKNKINEYQCIDVSEDMNTVAEFLLRGGKDIEMPLKIPNVYFKRFLPLSNQIKYDIVVSAYTLTEMPFQKQRMQAIKSLWSKTKDFLVLVEIGNNEGFETALQARRYIAGKDKETEELFDSYYEEGYFDTDDLEYYDEEIGHIFAPCTHELVCARTDVETRDHPCNFSQKVELSLAHKRTGLKHAGYYNERYSYIIFRKGKQDTESENNIGWARILEPIKRRKNHVICDLCCANGNIEKHIVTKRKDPDIYKAARHVLDWGDMMPVDKARRPQNIRPTPSCPKSK